MASYQTEFLCDMSFAVNQVEGSTDQNVYRNLDYSEHTATQPDAENGYKQLIHSPLDPELLEFATENDQTANFASSQFCNYSVTPHSSYQYTPLTPEPVSYPVFQLQPQTQPVQPRQDNHFMLRKHHAHITIAPTSKGNFKAVVKRKRKRTIFTTEQVEALEEIFKRKQYISREERQSIVQQLQINDKAVKIWFQNRRLKIKRMSEQSAEEQEEFEQAVEDRLSPANRLDVVESRINEKTDEFGYVTLDDVIMGNLANVIDDFLVKCLDVHSEESSGSDNSPVYEPISPASVTDSNDEDLESSTGWKPSQPKESLQRLFDLQTMLSL